MTALHRGLDQAALDAQYNLRQAVPAHPAYFARWAAASRAVRDRGRCRLDIPYGGGKLETLDLFLSPLFTALLAVMVKAAATGEQGRGVV